MANPSGLGSFRVRVVLPIRLGVAVRYIVRMATANQPTMTDLETIGRLRRQSAALQEVAAVAAASATRLQAMVELAENGNVDQAEMRAAAERHTWAELSAALTKALV